MLGLGAAVMAFILVSALVPFRRIWRGDAWAANGLPSLFGRVEARNYLAYLMWIVPGAGGLLLVCVVGFFATLFGVDNLAEDLRALMMVGVILFLAAWPLTLVHVFVNATGRPKFLVPPPYRDQPGEIGAWRQRRARRRAGLPPTDHVVETMELPDEDGRPWLMASCTEPQCDWCADVDSDLSYADAEDALRKEAGKHTTRVAGHIRRPLAEA
ncbi:MAG: hypothetical protein IRY92_13620 [Dactylosporangium sp.]|nr:hypothetical protein [Dactylosporangium sp.]